MGGQIVGGQVISWAAVKAREDPLGERCVFLASGFPVRQTPPVRPPRPSLVDGASIEAGSGHGAGSGGCGGVIEEPRRHQPPIAHTA